MRTGGIQGASEPGRSDASAEPTRSRRKVGLLAIVAVLAAVAGYFMLGRRPTAGEEQTVGPLSSAELRAELSSAQVDAGALAQLLQPEPSIERFAEQAAGSASDPHAKAEAITSAIRKRAGALAFVPWSLGEPRTTPVLSTTQVLEKLAQDRGRAELYPLEVAALAVAALRALDVPAMLSELLDPKGERAPLDPSGHLGYFAVAVYAGEAGFGAPKLFDPYGGRVLGEGAQHVVLRDTQAVGAALSLRALHEMAYLADPRAALESSSDALSLAGSLPSVRTVRAMVVLAGKQVEQGLQELAAARQLRSDAARLHNLATAELMTGDLDRATKDLQAALARAPDYAGAHATLGTLNLMQGEPERALAELRQAEELAPDLSLVQWALADYWLRTDDRERALETARRALEQRPSFDALLRMGVLLRQAGRYEEMRVVAKQLLERAPPHRNSELRELIRAALGPTALEDVDGQPSASSGEGAVPDLQLDLGGSAGGFLGGGDEAAEGPTLGGGEATSEDSRAPKLRLRDPQERFQLKLDR